MWRLGRVKVPDLYLPSELFLLLFLHSKYAVEGTSLTQSDQCGTRFDPAASFLWQHRP